MEKNNFIYQQKVRIVGGFAVVILAITTWTESRWLGVVFGLFALFIVAETVCDQMQWRSMETAEKAIKKVSVKREVSSES